MKASQTPIIAAVKGDLVQKKSRHNFSSYVKNAAAKHWRKRKHIVGAEYHWRHKHWLHD